MIATAMSMVFQLTVMSISLHLILPLALLCFFQLTLKIRHPIALSLPLGIVVAALSALRFLLGLVLAEKLSLQASVASSA